MDLIFLLIVGWALSNVWKDVTGKLRKDRDKRVTEVAKKMPGPMTPARKRQVAARHDAAWTAREVLTGFPVTRTAWHSAWLAHKTAAIQQRHQRELARSLHDEAHLGLAQRTGEYKARRAQIKAELDQVIECEPEPPRTAKAVRKAAGNVIHASFRRSDEPQEHEPVPPALAVAPAPAPPAEPVPGPYAARPAAAPGEWPAGIPHRRTNDTTATALAQGAPMPAVAEITTYDQCISEANREILKCDVRLADLRMQQFTHMAENLSPVMRDSATLGRIADVDDRIREEIKAVEAVKDTIQGFRDGLKRDHGGMAEAHQSAPVKGAQPEFYEGS